MGENIKNTAAEGVEMVYTGLNEEVLSCIPLSANRILDLGCGAGTLGKKIKEDRRCEIVGITISEKEQAAASGYLDKVLVGDLDEMDTVGLGRFDCIVCSHVLEHLRYPSECLKKVRCNLQPSGILVVALPNAFFWKLRFGDILKRVSGALAETEDVTHKHFFNRQTASALIRDSGFDIVSGRACGVFPLPLLRKIMPVPAIAVITISPPLARLR